MPGGLCVEDMQAIQQYVRDNLDEAFLDTPMKDSQPEDRCIKIARLSLQLPLAE